MADDTKYDKIIEEFKNQQRDQFEQDLDAQEIVIPDNDAVTVVDTTVGDVRQTVTLNEADDVVVAPKSSYDTSVDNTPISENIDYIATTNSVNNDSALILRSSNETNDQVSSQSLTEVDTVNSTAPAAQSSVSLQDAPATTNSATINSPSATITETDDSDIQAVRTSTPVIGSDATATTDETVSTNDETIATANPTDVPNIEVNVNDGVDSTIIAPENIADSTDDLAINLDVTASVDGNSDIDINASLSDNAQTDVAATSDVSEQLTVNEADVDISTSDVSIQTAETSINDQAHTDNIAASVDSSTSVNLDTTITVEADVLSSTTDAISDVQHDVNTDNANDVGNAQGDDISDTISVAAGGATDMSAEQPSDIQVRVSSKTDNQNTINSRDGADISRETLGEDGSITGRDMDIRGVRGNAEISGEFDGSNHADISLDSSWNSVKNIEVTSDDAGAVTVDNFVHTDISLGGSDTTDNSTVNVTGAKRGNITTADGDDTINVTNHTNNGGWSNTMTLDSAGGDDTINVQGSKDHTRYDISAGDGDDVVTAQGDYYSANVDLGAGNDSFSGTSGRDAIDGGTGNDTIIGGGGDDQLSGGAGNDTFVISPGDGHVTISDFTGVGGGGRGERGMVEQHDTLKFEGSGMDADAMLLSSDGGNTIVTFDGIEDFSVTLEGLDFTDLDNLPAANAFNMLFDGQETGTDAFDVFNDHNSGGKIWNNDIASHLNDADNTISGKNNSDDIINAMDGDDVIDGRSGDDVLRGQAGDDHLSGGKGDDIIDGGDGNDTASFSGNRADYDIHEHHDGGYEVRGVHNSDGTDIVRNVETFSFADGEVSEADILTVPTADVAESTDTLTQADAQEIAQESTGLEVTADVSAGMASRIVDADAQSTTDATIQPDNMTADSVTDAAVATNTQQDGIALDAQADLGVSMGNSTLLETDNSAAISDDASLLDATLDAAQDMTGHDILPSSQTDAGLDIQSGNDDMLADAVAEMDFSMDAMIDDASGTGWQDTIDSMDASSDIIVDLGTDSWTDTVDEAIDGNDDTADTQEAQAQGEADSPLDDASTEGLLDQAAGTADAVVDVSAVTAGTV